METIIWSLILFFIMVSEAHKTKINKGEYKL